MVFPCGIILSSKSGLSAAGLSSLIQQAGGATRFTYHSVKAAAAVVGNSKVLAALLAYPGTSVIPDRKVTAIAGAANPNKGGSQGQVVPAGVRRIGAAPDALSVTG